MRPIIITALLSAVLASPALADETVSGQWHGQMGKSIFIDMTVQPDGAWSSRTIQQHHVVREMSGTYTQTTTSAGTGTLVFTPSKSKVAKGAVGIETDAYVLADDGKQLKLTSDGDTMVFVKREAKK